MRMTDCLPCARVYLMRQARESIDFGGAPVFEFASVQREDNELARVEDELRRKLNDDDAISMGTDCFGDGAGCGSVCAASR